MAPAFCSIFSRGVTSGTGSSFLFLTAALLVAPEVPCQGDRISFVRHERRRKENEERMKRRVRRIVVERISLLTVLAPFSLLKKPAILGVEDRESETG